MAGLTESVPVGSYAWPALYLSLWLAIGACAWVPEGKGFPETPEPIVVTATIGGEALFDRGSSTLNEPSEAALSDLVLHLRRFQEISSIEVVGHDENTRNEADSLAISLERARSVANFLKAAYPDVPIEVRGVGDSAPVASNKTPEGRQLNRRVEVQIVARSVHAMDASVPESSPVPSRTRGGIDLLLHFSHWIPFESGRTDLPESSSDDVEAVLIALRRTALDCPVPLTVELVGSSDPDGNSGGDTHWLRSGEVENRLRSSLDGVELDIASFDPVQFLESFDPKRYRVVDRAGDRFGTDGVHVLHSCAPDATAALPDGLTLAGLARQLGEIAGSTLAVLGGVSDAMSARIAQPKLQDASERLNDFVRLYERLPEAAREPLRRVLRGFETRLGSETAASLTIPGVVPALEPIMSLMLETLAGGVSGDGPVPR